MGKSGFRWDSPSNVGRKWGYLDLMGQNAQKYRNEMTTGIGVLCWYALVTLVLEVNKLLIHRKLKVNSLISWNSLVNMGIPLNIILTRVFPY